jgi:hypothetical protein
MPNKEFADSERERLNTLRRIIESARDDVATKEEAAKKAREFLTRIEQNDVVEELRTLGLEDCTYTYADGAKLKIEQKVYASVTEDGKKEAYAWLKKNGHGAMIKSRCVIEFGRSEQHLAAVLQAFCDKMVPECEVTVLFGSSPLEIVTAINTFVEASFPKHKLEIEDHVHASTLRAFVTKQLKAGVSLPEEFKVHAPQVATLTLAEKSAEF